MKVCISLHYTGLLYVISLHWVCSFHCPSLHWVFSMHYNGYFPFIIQGISINYTCIFLLLYWVFSIHYTVYFSFIILGISIHYTGYVPFIELGIFRSLHVFFFHSSYCVFPIITLGISH